MAGDWIKLRTVLPDDGRLLIASRKCHATSVTTLGALVTLWCLADAHADSDGVILGYDADTIDERVKLPGFCAALPIDWIDLSGEWVKLPNYQEHNGTTAKARAQTTRRKQKARAVTPVPDVSRNERDQIVTREEKRREDIEASARTAGEGEKSGEVIDRNTGEIFTPPSVLGQLTPGQSNTVVTTCKALRKMGSQRFGPGDEVLAALSIEGFTAEQIVRCAGEKALRDASLLDDPDVHPELFDLFINGGTQAEMFLTAKQHTDLRGAVSRINPGYIATTLRNRRSDALNGASKPTTRSTRRPSATDNLEGKTYVGTPLDRIDPLLLGDYDGQ